jgi:hypothetical protein
LAHFDVNGNYDSSVAYPIGLVVSLNPPSVLYNGQFELEDSRPPARYLVVRVGELIWTDIVTKNDMILVYEVHSNLISIGENIMSYATGKSDFKDTKTYENQGWANAPIQLQPVKLDSNGLAPAVATDEVIVGIIASFEAVVDQAGNTTYDITIMVAEADLACPSQPASTIGQPLYVQETYTQATANFSDIYSVNPPSDGFTHPLLIVTAQESVHYNGTVRPEKV